MRRGKKLTAAALAIVLPFSLAACSDSGSADTVATGAPAAGQDETGTSGAEQRVSTLNIALTADSGGFDPYNGYGYALQYGLYESLFAYGYDGDYIPVIIDTYEIAEDGMSMTATIDDDIYTQNGYHVVASDILWSIQQVADSSSTRFASIFDLENSEALDETTVYLAFTSRWMDFNYDSLCHIVVTSQEAYENSPDHFYSAGEGATGPYRVESYEEGVQAVFVKSDSYRGGYRTQNVDRVVYKIIPEASQRLIAYENGEIDIIIDPNTNDIAYIEGLDGTSLYNDYAPKNMALVFNVTTGSPVEDALVRKAIGYAVNNADISDYVYGGLVSPAVSVISPLVAEWQEDWENGYDNDYYGYDPDKAKELLKEAGYEDGFSIDLAYSTSDGTYDTVAQVIQGQLAQIGITVSLQPYDNSSFSTLVADNEGWDFTLQEYKVQDSVLFTFYNKVNIYKSDLGGWYNEEFQKLLDDALYTMDADSISRMVELYEEDCVHYTLIYRTKQYAYRNGVNLKTCGDNFIYPGDWTYDEEAEGWLYD